jgi:PHD/YefM family antitoxin component YafN of YafNO toxin-antitoxin module
MNRVCSTHRPAMIKRRDASSAVLVSEEDWDSIQETLYLMSSPKDREAITQPIDVNDCTDSLPW